MSGIGKIQRLSISLGDINLSCLSAGKSGTPVILLHGAGVDNAAMSWTDVIKFLSKKHQVFAPDLPGYGESERPNVEHNFEFYVSIVDKLMTALELKKTTLIGLSLGGGISLAYTLKYPERVEKLVLTDAWGIFKKLPYHFLSYIYVKSSLNEYSYSQAKKKRDSAKKSLLNGLIGNPEKVTEELINEVYAALQDPDAGKAFASFQRSEIRPNSLRTDLAGRLSEITIPTLLVHGTKDTAVPVKYAQEAHKVIKGSKLYLMDECKHWPQKEKPEEFSKVVIDFLSNNNEDFK